MHQWGDGRSVVKLKGGVTEAEGLWPGFAIAVKVIHVVKQPEEAKDAQRRLMAWWRAPRGRSVQGGVRDCGQVGDDGDVHQMGAFSKIILFVKGAGEEISK
jgi:hypothetical protein